jgi:uroporphyrinogen-III synthase
VTRAFAVLRPEPGNAATAGRLEALGLTAIRLPLFEVRAVAWSAPDPAAYDALLLTSANAVRFGGGGLDAFKRLPVLAIGSRTASAAREAGFDVMAEGQADAAALAALATARGVTRALHLGGRDRSIGTGGPIAEAIAVYANDAVPIAAPQLAGLAGAVALLHSTRAAHRLAALVDAQGTGREAIRIAAFSAAIADATGPGWAGCVIAIAPNDAALIAAARALAD